MVDLVSSISSALEITKKLRDLNKKVGEAEFKMLLADLTSELGDAKLEAANLKILLAEAKAEIDEWKQKTERAITQGPELHDNGYIFGDPSRVYCTGCYDVRGQKVLLKQLTGPFAAFGKYSCPACERHYG